MGGKSAYFTDNCRSCQQILISCLLGGMFH